MEEVELMYWMFGFIVGIIFIVFPTCFIAVFLYRIAKRKAC